ncbi:TPA: type 1 fimbrial protein [Pseudomonas aeruginosa]|nr:type 1 fimbrial protein [Pseudomonas aeruginosa]
MQKIPFIAALILAAPLSANASDGTITFSGKIIDSTCIIEAGGSKDFTVNLPSVSKASLASTGAVSGRTPFTITLSGCGTGNVATYFEPGSTVDYDSGRLLNQTSPDAGGATNVELQLLGSTSEFLPIKAGSPTQTNSQQVAVDRDGTAKLDYYAEYYATGAATPGDINTNVKYTIIYL